MTTHCAGTRAVGSRQPDRPVVGRRPSPFAHLDRAEATVVADDVPQVSARSSGAAVEQFLKAFDLLRSLLHVPIRPQPCLRWRRTDRCR